MSLTDNSEKFLSVIQEHRGILYKVANTYCADPEDRKDLVQEMIIQLWRSFGRYSDQYKYSTWIYRIALNVAISFYRRESRRRRMSAPLPEEILLIDESHRWQETEQHIALLQEFISGLKEVDRALMFLYLEEKDQKEIAEILGLSLTNVATKIGRIKKILRQKFSNITI